MALAAWRGFNGGRQIWSNHKKTQLERREIVLGSKIRGKQVYDYQKAHDSSYANEELVRHSKICACFYCGNFFAPSQIEEWIKDLGDAKTALCPYCHVDSVLPDAAGYPLTEIFVQKMRGYWFG